jgi:hypothetical protein
MSDQPQIRRAWARLFGLLLTDFFTDSPFVVEVKRDMSVQEELCVGITVSGIKASLTEFCDIDCGAFPLFISTLEKPNDEPR